MVKPAERLIAAVSQLLPKAHRHWGRAMLAELSTIESRDERWRFAAGCLRAVCTRPVVLRRIGYPAFTAVALGFTLWWSHRFAYAPLRWTAMMILVLLVAVAGLGRVRGPFGPVRPDAAARAIRLAGSAVVTMWTVGLLTEMGTKDPIGTATAAPILGAVAAAYLAAFFVLTAASTTTRVLKAALAGGAGAVAVWIVAVFAAPPIPTGASFATLLIGLGMIVAAAIAGREHRIIAIGSAGMVGALGLISTVVVLSTYAPATLIPDLAPHALSPADDLAQSRAEIQDPYVVLLVVGGVLAVLPVLAALWRAGFSQTRPAPVNGSA
jgi:hypothetical protein